MNQLFWKKQLIHLNEGKFMNTTIVYNKKIQEDFVNRIIFQTNSQKEAYLYHLEHSNVDSYIINTDGMEPDEIKSMIEHIRYLNAIITILLFKPEKIVRELAAGIEAIQIIESEENIPESLHLLSNINRDSNRVQWPLQEDYWKPGTKDETLKRGSVLSISSSGCFIKTIPALPFEIDDPATMVFSFKFFDFYSEGIIVRLQKKTDGTVEGMAIKFKEVSPQTKKCIQEIINEKLLSEIMNTMNMKHD